MQRPNEIRVALTTNIDIRERRFRRIDVHDIPEASKDGRRAALHHGHLGIGPGSDDYTDGPDDDVDSAGSERRVAFYFDAAVDNLFERVGDGIGYFGQFDWRLAGVVEEVQRYRRVGVWDLVYDGKRLKSEAM